jgi:hypothetical protein
MLSTVSAPDGDCSISQAQTEFLSWTQVNERAAAAVTAVKFFPLTIHYYKRILDRLGSLRCDDRRALGDKAFLIGQGWSLQSISDWVLSYSSDKFVLKVLSPPLSSLARV